MKTLQIAFFAAVALAVAPAGAFTIQGGDGPADNSARYADPDEKLPQFNNQDRREPRVMRFGNSDFSLGFTGGSREPSNARPDSYEATHPSTPLGWDTRSRMMRDGR
jgi:hypothetical protein